MTPEQRENFKAEWRNKCDRWGRFKQRESNTPTAE